MVKRKSNIMKSNSNGQKKNFDLLCGRRQRGYTEKRQNGYLLKLARASWGQKDLLSLKEQRIKKGIYLSRQAQKQKKHSVNMASTQVILAFPYCFITIIISQSDDWLWQEGGCIAVHMTSSLLIFGLKSRKVFIYVQCVLDKQTK